MMMMMMMMMMMIVITANFHYCGYPQDLFR